MLKPLQVPAGPPKVFHTAPEVDGEPQPKKLCAPPSSDPGSKATVYRCYNCTGKCNHVTPDCIIASKDDFADSDDEIEYGEYQGKRDGYAWNCLLGCCDLTVDCSFDHGRRKTNEKYGKTKGFYVPKGCNTCGKWGHWTYECPSNQHQTNSNTAAADADIGEEIGTQVLEMKKEL